jgi:GTP-binding protein
VIPVVALVGRPNVGKSTLFNALTHSMQALVADRPGVTRDRHYGIAREGDRSFVVVDTGGLDGADDELVGLAAQQTRAAIDEAAVLVLVVDARGGVLPGDRLILDALRKQGKPLLLAVNKVDGVDEAGALAEFSRLGLPDMLAMSASNRRGTAALALRLIELLPAPEEPAAAAVDAGIKVAIIGRPNVGKSTLVNRLLGEDRVVASDIPGTTRDAISVALERDGRRYTLIDTAGVRRRGKVEDAIEKFSVIKTLQALAAANVAVVMLDASEGVTDQDSTVLGHALEAGRALVIAVNKWDGLDTYTRERCKTELDRRLDYVPYAIRLFISAKHGTGMGELMKAVDRAYRAATREISSSDLTRALEMAYEGYQPPLVNGRVAKLRYAHQGGRNPPRVVIHGSRIASLPGSYHRYLENFFRTRFKLEGTPVKLEFREGENPFKGRKNELTASQQRKRQRLVRHARRGKR